ncbi:hypothetical protein [Nocardioides pyridinolyticus]
MAQLAGTRCGAEPGPAVMKTLRAGRVWSRPRAGTNGRHHPTERSDTMLWTILIVLAIIALVLFILGRVRGGRGV